MSIIRIFEQKFDNHRKEFVIQKIKESVKEISFSGLQKSCCVGIVDIVNSTQIIANLSHDKMCNYFRIFLNSIAEIVKEFDGIIVKNIGDSLLYYFPRTSDAEHKDSLEDVLECGLVMIESRIHINKIMEEFKLPMVNYRVSSDYGKFNIAKYPGSISEDIFGSTINICSKINPFATPNSMIIGGDLQQITRSFRRFVFHPLIGIPLGMRLHYPVYSISRRSQI